MPSSKVIQPMPLRSALSIFVWPLSSRSVPTSLIRVDGRDRAVRQGGRGGHHLEHRARLVDGRDDRVDEPPGVGGRDRLVVVAVIGRIGRHRVDLAGVRVHDDRRGALGPVGDPRGEQLLLDPQLETGVDRQAQVGAGRAGLATDASSSIAWPPASRSRDDDPWLAGERRLVVLLDAVLAAALAIDEAEEVGREGRARSPADLRIDTLGFGLERQAEGPLVSDRRADPVGGGRARGRGAG